MEIEIQGRKIGKKTPVFIIAEAGVNHCGDIHLAKQLVLEAKKCGADCVKFQTFKAERVVTEDAPKAKHQLKNTDPDEAQVDMLKNCELKPEFHKDLIKLCNHENIVFLSTPYNIEDVDFLDSLGVPAFKLASIHTAEPYFVHYVAEKGKPIILSTGMASLGEICEAVLAIRDTGNEQFILLQCTTNYPSRLEDSNLRAMQTMGAAFDVTVGYSDHTQDDTACIVSVALGAKLIEKHLTLDKTLPGPDQSSAADPEEFACLVNNIRNAEKVLGSARKEPCEIERENAIGLRRSIVTRKGIRKGSVITEDMLTFKRPANGLPPKYFYDVVGRKAKRNLPGDALIDLSDLV